MWDRELDFVRRFAVALEGAPELPEASPEGLESHWAGIQHIQDLLSLLASLPARDRPPMQPWDDLLGPLWRRLFAKGDDTSRYLLSRIWHGILTEMGDAERTLRTLSAAAASARNFYLYDEALDLVREGRREARGEAYGALASLINIEGSIHYIQKDWDAAEASYRDALSVAERLPEEALRSWTGLPKGDFVAQEWFNINETLMERGFEAQGAERLKWIETCREILLRLSSMPLSRGFDLILPVGRTNLAFLSGDYAGARAVLARLMKDPSLEGPYRFSLQATHYRLMAKAAFMEGDCNGAYRWIRRALNAVRVRSYPAEEQFVLDQALAVLRTLHLREEGASAGYLVGDLVHLLEDKDWYTGGSHSRRVSALASKLGEALRERNGVSLDGQLLKSSGLLHDLGKLRIHWSLLNKTTPISQKERAILQQHPSHGSAFLRDIGMEEVAGIVEQHHERMDGMGYPRGIRPDMAAAIVGLCDVFEAAVTPNRRYKKPKRPSEALRELAGLAGTAFHPQAVDALIAVASR